ncbi:MAG TPA: HAD-IC family P-type ATPase [Dehalococcoidia bacterium]|nr:HAD-IC family P-type ATPase [Dehalococcoidia bacterium]
MASNPAPASISHLTGLTAAEASRRAAAGQANSITWTTSRTFGKIVRDNAASPINIVLFTISGMLLALQLFGDAVLTAGLVLGNVVAGVVQETRAKRQLDRIALLNRPQALVIRDGGEIEIAPEAIVVGDYLVLRPGDQVFVDGSLVVASGLGVDESLVTGESDIVPKRQGDAVISGTYCMAGSGVYEATLVGADTTASKITARARENRVPRTPLQREVGLVLWVMTMVVVILSLVVIRSFEQANGDVPLKETVRAAAVIVALVPQGLAVMVTVSYAMAAVRMAGAGLLIQRMNAVESISHVDVLCLDKTGTLTTNRLTVESLKPYGVSEAELQEQLGTFAASASFRNRTADAIQESFESPARTYVDEVAFDSSRKWSGLAFAEGGMKGAFVLGAPEYIAPHVTSSTAIMDAEEWVERGLRVLLFAVNVETQSFEREDGEPLLPATLTALGLVVLRDETRPDAAQLIAEFGQAGITLKVISGDHPDTVAALARQAGVPNIGEPVSGLDLAEVNDADLLRLAQGATIFGRISPHDKERIVSALRRSGGYVAMVGDGVNDVPALKAAQVALALRSGSVVTRDIADMVLLEDAFAALPRAFQEGQRIRRGMESIFRLFLTRTLSLTLLILVISLLNDPFPVTPRHTAMIAMLSVGIPSLFLAVWAKPGKTGRHVVLSGAGFVVPAAIGITAVGLVVYEFFLSSTDDLDMARTALTLTAISCGLLLILFMEPPSPAWVAVSPLSGDWRPVALAVALFALGVGFAVWPVTRDFYELVLPDAWGLALIAMVVFAWMIMVRAVWRFDLPGRVSQLWRRV